MKAELLKREIISDHDSQGPTKPGFVPLTAPFTGSGVQPSGSPRTTHPPYNFYSILGRFFDSPPTCYTSMLHNVTRSSPGRA